MTDNGLVGAALTFFACEKVTDDISVVSTVQGLICQSNDYKMVRPIFIVLAVYLIGLPLVTFIGLYRLYRLKLMSVEKTNRRYGFLFESYHHHRWYWEVYVLMRRVCLVSIAALVDNRFARAAGLTFANIVFTHVHSLSR
jgi:hypothetical protein